MMTLEELEAEGQRRSPPPCRDISTTLPGSQPILMENEAGFVEYMVYKDGRLIPAEDA